MNLGIRHAVQFNWTHFYDGSRGSGRPELTHGSHGCCVLTGYVTCSKGMPGCSAAQQLCDAMQVPDGLSL